MFMANGTIKQSEQGSAVELRLCHAPAQYAIVQGRAALVGTVRPVGTSSLPIHGRSGTSGATCRGHRGYGADHAQGSGSNSTYASSVCEKQWADDRRDCYTRIGCVSECSEKAWLSRAQRSARFKFTLSICLIVCTNQNSSRPTVFLCPFGNVSLAAV